MNPRDTAIEALEKYRPCDHHEYEECGAAGIWRKCSGCGLQFRADDHDAIRGRAKEFDTALAALRPEVHKEPVAMIHNDYDVSVRCSQCGGDDGGFGCYDDLEWAKYCPGCGGPISEQIDAKGVRTPHPLYQPPKP